MQVWLSANNEGVLIQVWDADEQMPARQQAESDAEHGRGLLLVESLSTAWGAYRPQRSNGKVVWATLQ